MDTAAPGLTRSTVRADWLVGGFAAVTSLYFSSEVMAYAIGGYGDAGALLGVLTVVLLSCCTFAAIRLAAMLAPGQATGPMLGAGTSVRVRSSVAIFVALYLTLIPALIAVSEGLGGGGTTDVPMGGRSAVFILLETWVAIVVAPWLEEVSVRGFLLSGLAPRLGFWPAAFASSLVWAAYHDVSVVLLPFTALGMLFCWLRRRTGTIRVGVALHACINTMVSYSHGGTVWVLVPLAAVALALWLARDGVRVRPVLARVGAAGSAAARRLTPPAARWAPWAWAAAGAAFTVNAMLVLTDVGADGGALHLANRTAVGAGFVALGWALLEARPRWELPPLAALAGTGGCLLGAASVAALSRTAFAASVALLCFGLVGVACGRLAAPARVTALAGAVLLSMEIWPVPYLDQIEAVYQYQASVAFGLLGVVLVALGVLTRDEPDVAAELAAA